MCVFKGHQHPLIECLGGLLYNANFRGRGTWGPLLDQPLNIPEMLQKMSWTSLTNSFGCLNTEHFCKNIKLCNQSKYPVMVKHVDNHETVGVFNTEQSGNRLILGLPHRTFKEVVK